MESEVTVGEILRRGLSPEVVCSRGPRERLLLEERQVHQRVALDTEGWCVTAIDVRKGGHPGIVQAKDWRLQCDYLLVCESSDDVQVVLIELKLSLSASQEGRALEQVRRSLPLWTYLATACAVEEPAEQRPSVGVRYAAIYSRVGERLAKQGLTSGGRGWTESWRGIEVREIVTSHLGVSELVGSARTAASAPATRGATR